MINFLYLKKKILKNNLKPKSFSGFLFEDFRAIDQKEIFGYLRDKRVRKGFKNKKKISFRKHLNYFKNYLQKPIINFVLLSKKKRNSWII